MVRQFAHASTGAKVSDIPSLVFTLSHLSRANPLSEVDRCSATRTTAQCSKNEPPA